MNNFNLFLRNLTTKTQNKKAQERQTKERALLNLNEMARNCKVFAREISERGWSLAVDDHNPNVLENFTYKISFTFPDGLFKQSVAHYILSASTIDASVRITSPMTRSEYVDDQSKFPNPQDFLFDLFTQELNKL
jgi:hypothetical protein